MSFVIYDLAFLVIFTLAVVLFLYTRKHNLKRQGLMYLYRTKVGLRVIEWTSKNLAGILKPMQYLVIVSGYILMGAMVWLLARFTWVYSTSDFIVEATKIPPVLPLVPYLPELFKVDFLPPFYFTYWIVIIAVIAISHEFAHGIFARLNNIKIHSTGFGFLGPFLAAFVEPDEKEMNKASKFAQLSVLAAGTFANVLMTVLFGLILWGFFAASFTPAGVNFNTYADAYINTSDVFLAGVPLVNVTEFSPNVTKITANGQSYLASGEYLESVSKLERERIRVFEDAPAINARLEGPIVAINNVQIIDPDQLRSEIKKYRAGQTVTITTLDDGERFDHQIRLGNKEGEAYLGIGFALPNSQGLSGWFYSKISDIKDPFVYYEANNEFSVFIYDLLWWLVIINISVALVNMLPVGIFDGGRFFYLTIFGITRNEKLASGAFKASTWILVGVLAWLMVRWAIVFF